MTCQRLEVARIGGQDSARRFGVRSHLGCAPRQRFDGALAAEW
jgi:hypothetical protein